MSSAVVGGVSIICPVGCAACSSSSVCSACIDGFSLEGSSCLQCDKTCRTCSLILATECTSCFPGQNLYSGKCLSCSDTLCLNCQNNYEFCLKCKPGYTAVNGVCKACAANCMSCDTAGANYCDINGCLTGFTRLRLDVCGQCLVGCSSCSPTDVSTCLGCLPGTYSSDTNKCTICPSACETCTDASTCQTCKMGYELSGSSCVSACAFPCATCYPNGECQTCFGGYLLTGTSCNSDLSCNTDSSCTNCPLGYSLSSGLCAHCTSSNCLRCNPDTVSECYLCSDGYFLETSTLLCSACSSPCVNCKTSDVCLSCKDGYFMQMVNNEPNGKCGACDSNCATCGGSPTHCLTCPTGSSLDGLKCISNQNIGFKLTFASPTAASPAEELQSFMIVMEEIRLNLGGVLGAPFSTTPELISFTSIVSGSVNVNGVADTSQSSPDETYNSWDNVQPSGGYVGFALVSSSYVANGFTPAESS